MTFVFNYNRKQLERACDEFTEIQKIADNEVCAEKLIKEV